MRLSEAVARSYAKALFALATERDQAEAIGRELDALVEVVRGDAQLAEFFARPGIAAAAKKAAAEEIAGRLELSRLTRDFAGLVAAHGRAQHVDAIAAAYRDMLDAAANRVRARVRTAVPLTDTDRSALATRLSRALEGKQVVLEERVDPRLLGGFVAEVDSLIVDGSLDGQLARLRETLAKG